jgi:DNA-binding NarL/FixJ family response regulator
MASRRGGDSRVIERVERLCEEPSDDHSLRTALLAEIGREVPFDWHAWLLTDPETEVGSAPIARVPSMRDLPRLIRAKYLTEVNRWTGLDRPVASLQAATGGDLRRSHMWRELLSGYGVVDMASLVFHDPYGCWGWLDLWRGAEQVPFDDRELRYLAGIAQPITAALRRSVADSFVNDSRAAMGGGGPLVLVVSPDLEVKAQTAETEEYLRILIPPFRDHRAIPAAAYNVAAQVLSVEAGVDAHHPTARVHLRDGAWLSIRAARIDSSEPVVERDIAVSIEAASPAHRRDLFARSNALSPRESEVVEQLSQGADTRTVALQLFMSEHTVQDHLKSIFTKTGVRNRRTLLARLAGL